MPVPPIANIVTPQVPENATSDNAMMEPSNWSELLTVPFVSKAASSVIVSTLTTASTVDSLGMLIPLASASDAALDARTAPPQPAIVRHALRATFWSAALAPSSLLTVSVSTALASVSAAWSTTPLTLTAPAASSTLPATPLLPVKTVLMASIYPTSSASNAVSAAIVKTVILRLQPTALSAISASSSIQLLHVRPVLPTVPTVIHQSTALRLMVASLFLWMKICNILEKWLLASVLVPPASIVLDSVFHASVDTLSSDPCVDVTSTSSSSWF